MKISKKIAVLVMAALLAAVSTVPATFSWYTHNDSSIGQSINYNRSSLPVSVMDENNDVTMTTVLSDKNGEKTSNSVTAVNVAAGKVQYYMTTFENNSSNDVYVDLQLSKLKNNADYVVGTLSPTLNEKAFASRAARTKSTYNLTRVYFKTNSSMSSYWSKDNGRLIPETGTYYPDGTSAPNNAAAGSDAQKNSETGTNNDINISYVQNGKEYQAMMLHCPNQDTNTSETNTGDVYYYDIPSDSEYFFFFNHYYLKSSSNRNWNRTLDITDTKTKGRLFYLTGNRTTRDYKEYKVRSINTNLAALNSYYSEVRMSLGSGVYADIGLKKDSDEEGFFPEYYGSSISYSSSDTSVATVNKDGLITPKLTGNAVITTTITGVFGDTIDQISTAVNIPADIDQVPVLENIRVPQGETVDVHWYALNKSDNISMTTDSIFFTL